MANQICERVVFNPEIIIQARVARRIVRRGGIQKTDGDVELGSCRMHSPSLREFCELRVRQFHVSGERRNRRVLRGSPLARGFSRVTLNFLHLRLRFSWFSTPRRRIVRATPSRAAPRALSLQGAPFTFSSHVDAHSIARSIALTFW